MTPKYQLERIGAASQIVIYLYKTGLNYSVKVVYNGDDLTPFIDVCMNESPCPYDLWMKHIKSRFYINLDEQKQACAVAPTPKDFLNSKHNDVNWNQTIKTETLKEMARNEEYYEL